MIRFLLCALILCSSVSFGIKNTVETDENRIIYKFNDHIESVLWDFVTDSNRDFKSCFISFFKDLQGDTILQLYFSEDSDLLRSPASRFVMLKNNLFKVYFDDDFILFQDIELWEQEQLLQYPARHIKSYLYDGLLFNINMNTGEISSPNKLG